MAEVVKQEIIDGKKVTTWRKICPCCKKAFETTSRRQKYCCNEHAVKHAKKLKDDRARYDKVKEFERIRSRAHKMATDTIDLLVAIKVRNNVCECCGQEFDEKHPREVHHRDLNWLNNDPSNLLVCCKKCHAKEHSRLEAELNEKGILLEEFYAPGIKPILDILNKNCQR